MPTSGSYTVVFDEQAGDLGSTTSIFEIISQGRSGGPGFYIGYDGGLNCRLGDSWASGGLAYPIDGNWHRLALFVNDVTPRSEFYVDGVLLNSVPFALVTGLTGGADAHAIRQAIRRVRGVLQWQPR
ncbi:MAG: hypothetical protein EXQ52_05045 [Bryobacterales bacterium]|nr:hypothetical protein [Bryobacterales bacterium]